MKKTTTSDYSGSSDCDLNRKKEGYLRIRPKEKTLDFLKQFARLYHVESKLPKEVSGMILN